jgi:hypothetical protein
MRVMTDARAIRQSEDKRVIRGNKAKTMNH